MHITKIILENVRCFKHVELDLGRGEDAKRWAVIVGNNAVGKTTFLRSIAMGLCDKDSAAALLWYLGGNWMRKGTRKPASIKLRLRDGNKDYEIETSIKKSPAGFETVTQTTSPPEKDFPWNKIFVCGYGANRRTEGSMKYEEYWSSDAVYTLFNYDWSLQDPELMLRRIAPTKHQQKEICSWIDDILMLKKGSTQLADRGLMIKVNGRHGIYLGSLADGHEATLTWILDMLGWGMSAGQAKKGAQLSGIVIIDELEQHLHPKWQRHIISLLHERFPEIQFIVATHSPLCAGGTADLETDNCRLGLLRQRKDGSVELIDKVPTLGGWRADQILASELFGYIIEANEKTEKLLREASILAGKGKKRTSADNARYKSVKTKLESILFSDGATLIERELIREKEKKIAKKTKRLEKKLFGSK